MKLSVIIVPRILNQLVNRRLALDEIKILPRSGYGPWEDNSLDSSSIKSERPHGINIEKRYLVATKDYKCGLCSQLVRKGQFHFHNHKRLGKSRDRDKYVKILVET